MGLASAYQPLFAYGELKNLYKGKTGVDPNAK
jgi:hypothetical protein